LSGAPSKQASALTHHVPFDDDEILSKHTPFGLQSLKLEMNRLPLA